MGGILLNHPLLSMILINGYLIGYLTVITLQGLVVVQGSIRRHNVPLGIVIYLVVIVCGGVYVKLVTVVEVMDVLFHAVVFIILVILSLNRLEHPQDPLDRLVMSKNKLF